jgi:hypothetical protein
MDKLIHNIQVENQNTNPTTITYERWRHMALVNTNICIASWFQADYIEKRLNGSKLLYSNTKIESTKDNNKP